MKKYFIRSTFKSTFLFSLLIWSCSHLSAQTTILPGALQQDYLSQLKGKKVGVVAHQASLLPTAKQPLHLVDYLLENNIVIQSVFAPEHGFRGTADAGEKVANQTDPKTGLPIISLYGKNRKPTKEQLAGLDVLVFDLQDVGVRFYTYLSTLHYVMEACAENNIPLIVLDRPNPNIHYVDGPVLEEEHTSFVGMHPVPIVYGMTIGEYAQMINGEGWLQDNIRCDLTVMPVKNYLRTSTYELPVRPSPNLPNAQAVALYPSLCLLEPTVISVGRGTDFQFQIYGHPKLPKSDFSFTPMPNFGSKTPKHKGLLCNGEDLTKVTPSQQVELKWLIHAFQNFPDPEAFFLKGFERIAGNSSLRKQLSSGMEENDIRNSWKPQLQEFKKIRARYLIYR
jgi:uncharacterized protein YbbC (DUF1343 family)